MNNKLKCIYRYIELYGYSEIKEYLISNKLVDSIEANTKSRIAEQAELVYVALLQAEKNEALLLLSFEWKLLPFEQIKITCISTREERFFTHGY